MYYVVILMLYNAEELEELWKLFKSLDIIQYITVLISYI